MRYRSKLLFLLTALMACSSDPSGPDDDDDGAEGFRAKIDGVTWTPTFPVTAVNAAPGLYSISGIRTSGLDYTMVLSLYNIKGTGTYPLGVTPLIFGGSAVLSRPPNSGWSTPLDGVAGEITISTLTASRMVGRFRFNTAPLTAGVPGAPVVTDGEMDIPVTGTGGLARDFEGSKLTGNIGGAFAASGATGQLINIGNGPVLTVTATNTTRGITISVANMTGPGTYALSSTQPVRSIGVSGANGNLTAAWLSTLSGGGGTVTVTSVTATRIAGSFNATLIPSSAGATGNLSVSGEFDLGRQQF